MKPSDVLWSQTSEKRQSATILDPDGLTWNVTIQEEPVGLHGKRYSATLVCQAVGMLLSKNTNPSVEEAKEWCYATLKVEEAACPASAAPDTSAPVAAPAQTCAGSLRNDLVKSVRLSVPLCALLWVATIRRSERASGQAEALVWGWMGLHGSPRPTISSLPHGNQLLRPLSPC
jgi:hypothetical protein